MTDQPKCTPDNPVGHKLKGDEDEDGTVTIVCERCGYEVTPDEAS